MHAGTIASPSSGHAVSDHAPALLNARRAGYVGLGAFGLLLLAWASLGTFSGAVIAPGQFVFENNLRKVQHAQGGLVAALAVHEGDLVAAGDLLLKLDATVAQANLQVIRGQLGAFSARAARLTAERDALPEPSFSADLVARVNDPEVAALLAAERRLFAARVQSKDGQRSQLRERLFQLASEATGLAEQREAKRREWQVLQRELSSVRQLYGKRLVQLTRLSALERENAALEGQIGQLGAQVTQTDARSAETRLQLIQLTADVRADAMKELNDLDTQMAELRERRVAAEDQVRRIDLRAPVAGVVQQLAVHTIGGVVGPGEPIMVIAPSGDALHIEARIGPADYDQVHMGQAVEIKLHAFNQRSVPQMRGEVSRMAADVTRDPQAVTAAGGAPFYTVRVSIPREELRRLEPFEIVAGMSADVFLQTESRSALSYLFRPVLDHLQRGFRER